MLGYYDRDGMPISLEEWCRLLGAEVDGKPYKVIRQEHVGHYHVSTVWLGLDHGFQSMWPGVPPSPPIIFETMVFASSASVRDAPYDMDSRRYATEAEAIAGHDEFVTLIRATQVELPDEVAPSDCDADHHD